jgi:hypothetical protein
MQCRILPQDAREPSGVEKPVQKQTGSDYLLAKLRRAVTLITTSSKRVSAPLPKLHSVAGIN